MMKRLIIVALLSVFALPASAQQLSKMAPSSGAVSRDDMTARLERTALGLGSKSGDRFANIDMTWPSSPDEYSGLDKNVVVLVCVVSADEKELPLRRVYADNGGKITELTRLTSMRSIVAKNSIIVKKIGRYREDSFYLAPAAAMMQSGSLMADFATKKSGFKLHQLPDNPPDFVKADGDPLPSGRGPDSQVLKTMLAREYQGFDSLRD
jgi:hypothetical protein